MSSPKHRRLAAIMFTDMVGYTLLGQKNESLALSLLEEQQKLIRPILTRHNGREVKTTGDGFLVEFPSALEAVKCAYDIQTQAREYNDSTTLYYKLSLRIGIHLGDIVDTMGDISGDAVNVASRIQSLAEEGGVCLTRQVYDHVQNKFDLPFESLGPKLLKNVKTPIEVFKLQMPSQSAAGEGMEGLDKRRIAVLPLKNLSPDPNDEYFADGMTEELITSLSKIGELTVIARTSVMQFKNSNKRVADIGHDLKTGTILEGSVRKAANKFRITIQMIDAENESHLWGQNYDRQMDDIFAIQSEIAENVADALKIRLVDSERQTLESRPTKNTEAYTLYLKGRYYWSERTKASVERGIAYLQKAVQTDPSLAVAYSDLADAYSVMADYGMVPSAEAYEKVREYARTALALDPKLSQPHAAMGSIHQWNWNWADAEKEFKLAIQLNPNNATAHHWYALYLSFLEKPSAMEEWKKAKELNPLSQIIGAAYGYSLVRAGLKEKGLRMLKETIDLNDEFVVAHVLMGYAYIVAGMKDKALGEAKKLLSLKIGRETLPHVANMYAAAGLRKEALSELERLLKHDETEFTDSCEIAVVYAALGDKANTLSWLGKAVNEKSAVVTRILFYPWFDQTIRKDPKFREIARKIGLESGNA